MERKAVAMLAAGLAVMAGPAGVSAHGRNSTGIRAAVSGEQVEVVISAVVLDLLQASGSGWEEWAGLDQPGRARRVRAGAEELARRFRVVRDRKELLEPDPPEYEVPDFGGPGLRWMDAGQLAIPITLRYPLLEPPEELTFWQVYEGEGVGEPILTQLLIRQRGQLIMLPAELGTGFLVSFPFDWSGEGIPIEQRTSLASATCRWQNRPANGLLEVRPGLVTWRVCMPLAALLADLEMTAEDGHDGVFKALRAGFSLRVDGQVVDLGTSEIKIFPLSAHALAHGEPVISGQPLDGMVEMRTVVRTAADPARIEVACKLFGKRIPVFYQASSASPAGEVRFSILNPEKPSQIWSMIPLN